MEPSPQTLVSYAQNREDMFLWALLGHREAGTYVDVGCNDERFHSVTRLFYERGWSGLNIDANPAFELQYGRRTRDQFVWCGVGAEPGEAMFRIYRENGGLSTFDDDIKSLHESSGMAFEDVMIPVRTLDAILADAGIRSIDFLKVDVEGVEPAVLRGLDLNSIRPSVIVLEASRVDACEAILSGAAYHREFFDGLNLYYADDDADDVNILNYAGRVLSCGLRTDHEQTLVEELDQLRAEAASRAATPDPDTTAEPDEPPAPAVDPVHVRASSPRGFARRLVQRVRRSGGA